MHQEISLAFSSIKLHHIRFYCINYCPKITHTAEERLKNGENFQWDRIEVKLISRRQSPMTIDRLIVTAPIVAFIARTSGNEIYFLLIWHFPLFFKLLLEMSEYFVDQLKFVVHFTDGSI